MNRSRSFNGSRKYLAVATAGISLLLQLMNINTAKAGSGDSIRVTEQYKKLITAENDRDTLTIKGLLYRSQGTLLVAKTQTKDEGGWAGFWGDNTVMQHLTSMITSGVFRIDPNCQKLRTFFIKPDIAEIYAPVQIAVSYAGQNPVPRQFVMVTVWIKVKNEWKMQSDIAIPVPQS